MSWRPSAVRRARRFALSNWEIASAVRQAQRFRRAHRTAVRVCWDLDNTIVDSGSLIRGGKSLEDAIADAAPMENMLDFYVSLRRELPDASHFILSARPHAMRRATLEWLTKNGVTCTDSSVCFVPHPSAKQRVWKRLARDAELVIVDDLSYGHEGPEASVHTDLVEFAERTASVYVGIEQIARIADHREDVEALVSRIASAVSDDKVANPPV